MVRRYKHFPVDVMFGLVSSEKSTFIVLFLNNLPPPPQPLNSLAWFRQIYSGAEISKVSKIWGKAKGEWRDLITQARS